MGLVALVSIWAESASASGDGLHLHVYHSVTLEKKEKKRKKRAAPDPADFSLRCYATLFPQSHDYWTQKASRGRGGAYEAGVRWSWVRDITVDHSPRRIRGHLIANGHPYHWVQGVRLVAVRRVGSLIESNLLGEANFLPSFTTARPRPERPTCPCRHLKIQPRKFEE